VTIGQGRLSAFLQRLRQQESADQLDPLQNNFHFSLHQTYKYRVFFDLE